MTAADDNDGVSWLGVSAILIFYLVILVIGILAGWFKTRKGSRHSTEGATQNELAIVAGRDIGVVVGIFTMIATWVGGGYINGTAEVVFRDGLLNAQAPVGYAISLIVGGLLFAKTMRERRYLTMIDPFQERYGVYIGGLMYLPALFGELLWSAAVLNALGATVAVVVGLNGDLAVIISACFAILYTFVGGQYSVAYTDVAQLICIVLGLVSFDDMGQYFGWSIVLIGNLKESAT
uniref:High affinity choline transporter 1 n=1 Tax=Plectus sambesii TaxID=2011161 RepID=A0A914WQ39_9BILA